MIALRVQPGLAAARALTEIKLIACEYPGDHSLELRFGDRALRLGAEWLYQATEPCLSRLSEFGTIEIGANT